MLKQNLMITVALLISSCLVSGGKDDTDSQTLGTGSGDSWETCLKLFKKEWTSTDGGHIISRLYRHKRSCVDMKVGWYKKYQRMHLNDDTALDYNPTKRFGVFDLAANFARRVGIGCKESRTAKKGITLIFPRSEQSHDDYTTVDIICQKDTEVLNLKIGLDEEDGKALAITITHRTEGVARQTYQAFDTDDEGVIKRHVKVIGAGGQKEVILDNYQLQN